MKTICYIALFSTLFTLALLAGCSQKNEMAMEPMDRQGVADPNLHGMDSVMPMKKDPAPMKTDDGTQKSTM